MRLNRNLIIKFLIIAQWMLLTVIIFLLSHQSKIAFIPQNILEYDKLLHFVAYFVYGLSTIFMLKIVRKQESNIYLISFIITTAFAISDEIHQYFIPDRLSDPYDLIADLFGIISSFLFFNLILKKIQPK